MHKKCIPASCNPSDKPPQPAKISRVARAFSDSLSLFLSEPASSCSQICFPLFFFEVEGALLISDIILTLCGSWFMIKQDKFNEPSKEKFSEKRTLSYWEMENVKFRMSDLFQGPSSRIEQMFTVKYVLSHHWKIWIWKVVLNPNFTFSLNHGHWYSQGIFTVVYLDETTAQILKIKRQHKGSVSG